MRVHHNVKSNSELIDALTALDAGDASPEAEEAIRQKRLEVAEYLCLLSSIEDLAETVHYPALESTLLLCRSSLRMLNRTEEENKAYDRLFNRPEKNDLLSILTLPKTFSTFVLRNFILSILNSASP